MAIAGIDADHISREAGDTQKGIRFQKLRAAIRFLDRVGQNVAGRVYCAIEFLEDSMLLDGSGKSMLSGEENKLYSSALSFNSPAIKNTIVAFLDLLCAFRQSDELSLGIYASAELADERISAEICSAAGLPTVSKAKTQTHSILKKLVSGTPLSPEEQLLARHLAIEEYRNQYAASSRVGFLKIVEEWSAERFGKFLRQIEWSVSTESNDALESAALTHIRESRFFSHRHEGLETFILSRLLDELEKRSHSTNAIDRLISTADVELIFMKSVGDAKLGENSTIRPPDPAADTWASIEAKDQRNLEEKILAVSPNYPSKALQRLARLTCPLPAVPA